jgi:hypothetical protein
MVAIKSSDGPIVIKEVDAVAWMDSSNNIQSRLKVSLRVAPKPAFLMCIGGWCQPMIEVELPYLLDFLVSYPLPLRQ